MPEKNEPLLLRPAGKDYLWGGTRLNDDFEKNIPLSPLAEVLEANPGYLGARHRGETGLPILIKFIDAKKDLSVQVHPGDDYARLHENGQLGKTEMWYVLDAKPDTKLVYGLRRSSL